MLEFLLTQICNINRTYQRNKKEWYNSIFLEPSTIINDIFNILGTVHIP